jgi:hypothetical protein
MQRVTLIAVSTKARFKRVVPKSYSYRYQIGATAGPDGQPLVDAGAAIIETRYRGRAASWNVSASMMSDEKYLVNGSYVAPDPENPMTYPPGTVPRTPPPAAAPPAAGATPPDEPVEKRVYAFGRKFARPHQ